MKNLGAKMAKGAAWMVLFKLSERSLGLISTIILVRLLVPADFGLVAMAMSIIAALELLSAFGFDMALIQNQAAERRHYDTAWTLSLSFSVISALILCALAGPAADFYDEARVTPVIYWLALGTVLHGLQNIGVVAFRKELEFNLEFRFLLTKKIAGFITTVPLAFALRNYWALVIGMLTANAAGVIVSYWWHPYRPRLSLAGFHELYHFSKWLFINNIFTFLRLRSAHFIIGRLAGPHALGLFSVSHEISNLPTTQLIAPINRAVYPGYAKHASDRAGLRHSVLNVSTMIAFFALPAGAGIAVIAAPLVRVFLGDEWVEATPLIRILALAGIATALQTNFSYVYLAVGSPRTTTTLTGAYLAVLIPALVACSLTWGVIGAAWAYLGTALLFTPVNYLILMKILNVAAKEILAAVWRPLVATGAMALLLNALVNATQASPVLQLALAVALGSFSYSATVLILWYLSGRPDGSERFLLDKTMPKLRTALRI